MESSSDEDFYGNPINKKPFDKKDTTFDFNGKPIKVTHPTIKMSKNNDM
jgi:hypothetical protein